MQLADHPQKFALSLSKDHLIKSLLFAEFFFLCSSFNLFDLGGRNLLFISFTVLAGLIILACTFRNIPKASGGFILLLVYLPLSFLFNISVAKTSSFLYSVFFLFSFWLISSFFKRRISQTDYTYLLRSILLAYFIVLILGQLYVVLGFFTQNVNVNTGVIHNPFGTLYEPGRSAYRFYSLSTEPSSAAFVVIVLFYSYIVNNPERQPLHKKNIPLWLMLFYMITFFKSGYGVILLSLLLIAFFRKKENFIPFLALALVLFAIMVVLKSSAIERVSAIVTKLDLSNIFSMQAIDYSASFRVLPIFHYLRDIDLLDPHFYLGHGAGTSGSFLIPLIFGSPVASYEGGFLPQFLYDYGILLLVLLILFLRENVGKKLLAFEIAVILLMMTNANFNTQLFWITICCFSLNKHYVTQQIGTL
jgi:hypothetical protein